MIKEYIVQDIGTKIEWNKFFKISTAHNQDHTLREWNITQNNMSSIIYV